MEINEQAQREAFNSELTKILESENLPSVPNRLDITELEELPDLSEWRK